METYSRMFDVPFQELLGTLEARGVSPKVDLLVAGPLYNFRRESGRFSFDCDVFSTLNIAEMFELCTTL